MNKRIIGTALLSLAMAGLVPLSAWAAAPGLVTTPAGVPATWDNSRSIVFGIDQGTLGRLSNTRAARLVLEAFDVWDAVETAQLQFEEGDPLDRNVDGNNIAEFLFGGELPANTIQVIFDHDGFVTERFFGSGTALTRAAFGFNNFAGWITPEGRITQGVVVINGRMMDDQFDPDDLQDDEVKRAIVRAIGEVLNLGSSDLNDSLIVDGNVDNNRSVPIMHPLTQVGLVVGGGFTPTLDDRMGISMLYPAASLQTTTGLIRGQVVLPDGSTGLQGIAVIAHKADDPVNSAVSAITGVNFSSGGRGSRDLNLRGAFEMRVPAGAYTIEFRPLERPIGPLGQIFPLPGGAQYYQAAPMAGPADPTNATPLTVTAGQTVEIKFTTGGTAAPAPQTLAETEPNDSPLSAPLLPPSASVTGSASPTDASQIVAIIPDVPSDRIEDLYRLDVRERSILTIQLKPNEERATQDLDLYLFSQIVGFQTTIRAAARTRNNQAEALQVSLRPGTYYIGASALDTAQQAEAIPYTLSVTTTPIPEDPPRVLPLIHQLVIGNVTATSVEARWTTDLAATADAFVTMPRQQFGDPTLGQAHLVPIGGLTAGAVHSILPVSQTADGVVNELPKLFFRTASQTAATGPANLTAFILGILPDTISTPDREVTQVSQLVAVAIQNTGGNAANVQLSELQAPSGWQLAAPVTGPLAIGKIDSGGTAIVLVRLLREGTGPAPSAAVTGGGTFAGADGAPQNFTIGSP